MLKAQTLAYTLLISMLVSGLLSAFWLMERSHQKILEKWAQEEGALANLQSGLSLFLLEAPSASRFGKAALFGKSEDPFTLETEPWGYYQLAHLRASRGPCQVRRSLLLGQVPEGSFAHSLFLAHHRQALCLAGSSWLDGVLYLPSSGLKTGQVLGKKYQYARLPQAEMRSSFLKEPSPWKAPSPQIEDFFHRLPPSDSSCLVLRNRSWRAPWDSLPLVLQYAGDCKLLGGSIQGKVWLSAAGNLEVGPEARIDMALLMARSIRIRAGFRGRLQAFATEELVLDSGVMLDYPSLLLMLPEGEGGRLEVGKNALIRGGIGWKSEGKAGYALLAEGSRVQGHVWGMPQLDLRGQVDGSVITDAFCYRAPTRHYQNHLLDARISFDALPSGFAMPWILPEGKARPAAWLDGPSFFHTNPQP